MVGVKILILVNTGIISKRAVAFPQIPTLIVLIEHEKSALPGATGEPQTEGDPVRGEATDL